MPRKQRFKPSRKPKPVSPENAEMPQSERMNRGPDDGQGGDIDSQDQGRANKSEGARMEGHEPAP